MFFNHSWLMFHHSKISFFECCSDAGIENAYIMSPVAVLSSLIVCFCESKENIHIFII